MAGRLVSDHCEVCFLKISPITGEKQALFGNSEEADCRDFKIIILKISLIPGEKPVLPDDGREAGE